MHVYHTERERGINLDVVRSQEIGRILIPRISRQSPNEEISTIRSDTR